MKKILLVFSSQVRDQDGFEALIRQFQDQGFEIRRNDDLNYDSFDMEQLPELLNKSCSQTDQHIIVLSNFFEIIFCWFRIYNSLVDDFVYFIDHEAPIYLNLPKEREFYQQIYSLTGIENETLTGRIFFNLNTGNYSFLFPLLSHQNNFRYFELISNMKELHKNPKPQIQKSYYYDDKKYVFPLDNPVRTEDVPIHNAEQTAGLFLNQELMNHLDQNLYFLLFFMKEMHSKYRQATWNFVLQYFYHLAQLGLPERKQVCSAIIEYTEQNRVDFYEKINFLTLLPLLQADDYRVTACIMKCLLDDYDYIPYHYPVLMNTLGFINRNNLYKYDDYELDWKKEHEKIVGSFRPQISYTGQREPKEKRIAIRIDQLLALEHSPSKTILDYVTTFQKIFPEYRIKIFVEDNFINSASELITVVNFSSVPSAQVEDVHRKYLGEADIPIFYSDPEADKLKRTQRIISEITHYNPEVILATGDVSLADPFLFSEYPMVFASMGEFRFANPADVYLYPDREDTVAEYNKHSFPVPGNLFEYRWGSIFPEATKPFERLNYGFAQTDFIMVTVGNRLNVEMPPEYIDRICGFIKPRPDVKWLVLGGAQLNYMEDHYPDLLNQQIFQIDYEPDLAGLCQICDVYLNPPRRGGGFSVAISMNAGLPVVIFGEKSDGLLYVGPENHSGHTYEAYLAELEKLYLDREYRKKRGDIMKKRLDLFGIDHAVRKLIDYIHIAERCFHLRKSGGH